MCHHQRLGDVAKFYNIVINLTTPKVSYELNILCGLIFKCFNKLLDLCSTSVVASEDDSSLPVRTLPRAEGRNDAMEERTKVGRKESGKERRQEGRNDARKERTKGGRSEGKKEGRVGWKKRCRRDRQILRSRSSIAEWEIYSFINLIECHTRPRI